MAPDRNVRFFMNVDQSLNHACVHNGLSTELLLHPLVTILVERLSSSNLESGFGRLSSHEGF